jgi:hypothetical protein
VFVDHEPVSPLSAMPSLPMPPAPPLVEPTALSAPVVAAEPSAPTDAVDHSASYWVRRRRQQELLARAIVDGSPL